MATITLEGGFIEYREAPGEVVEIVNIEVTVRRKGWGRKLLEALFAEIGRYRPNGKPVYAITRADNIIAQEFYEGTRFRVAGVLRRFYDTNEKRIDAVVYSRISTGPV